MPLLRTFFCPYHGFIGLPVVFNWWLALGVIGKILILSVTVATSQYLPAIVFLRGKGPDWHGGGGALGFDNFGLMNGRQLMAGEEGYGDEVTLNAHYAHAHCIREGSLSVAIKGFIHPVIT